MSARIAGIVLWLLATVVASAQAQTVEYVHTDALGSVVAVTNASRTVLERREYEPYGSQLTPAASNGPGYTGHVQDAATGLVYMQQRYYDAQIGQFLSVDPVTAYDNPVTQFHRYRYGNNNPYRHLDPDGRNAITLGRIVATVSYEVAGKLGAAALGSYLGIKLYDVLHQEEATPDEPKTSDREPGPDGKRGATGGPGAGKRFPAESPEVRASKEGVPCRYCGKPTTNEPGTPNSRERDHIDPKSRDGNNSKDNEGDSCRSCNRGKGKNNPDEWKPKERLPEKP